MDFSDSDGKLLLNRLKNSIFGKEFDVYRGCFDFKVVDVIKVINYVIKLLIDKVIILIEYFKVCWLLIFCFFCY